MGPAKAKLAAPSQVSPRKEKKKKKKEKKERKFVHKKKKHTKLSYFSCLQIAAMKEEIPTESETPGHDHTTLETTCLNACALAMERESGLVNQLRSVAMMTR